MTDDCVRSYGMNRSTSNPILEDACEEPKTLIRNHQTDSPAFPRRPTRKASPEENRGGGGDPEKKQFRKTRRGSRGKKEPKKRNILNAQKKGGGGTTGRAVRRQLEERFPTGLADIYGSMEKKKKPKRAVHSKRRHVQNQGGGGPVLWEHRGLFYTWNGGVKLLRTQKKKGGGRGGVTRFSVRGNIWTSGRFGGSGAAKRFA